jgi:hypothetical protein
MYIYLFICVCVCRQTDRQTDSWQLFFTNSVIRWIQLETNHYSKAKKFNDQLWPKHVVEHTVPEKIQFVWWCNADHEQDQTFYSELLSCLVSNDILLCMKTISTNLLYVLLIHFFTSLLFQSHKKCFLWNKYVNLWRIFTQNLTLLSAMVL